MLNAQKSSQNIPFRSFILLPRAVRSAKKCYAVPRLHRRFTSSSGTSYTYPRSNNNHYDVNMLIEIYISLAKKGDAKSDDLSEREARKSFT